MKFLKSQNTSRYSPSDNSFQVNPYGRAVMDFNGAVMVPKGTTAERPDITNVRQPAEGNSTYPANGYLRFNTDTNSFEGYINGVWEVMAAPSASAITKQTLGPGDSSSILFGPMVITPLSADNLLVFVENVFQISTTNFGLIQNPYLPADGDGEEVLATLMSSGTEYVIISLGTTDFTLVGAGWETSGSFTVGVSYTIKVPGTTDFVTEHGAADNNVGTTFTAAVAGTGTGQALPATYSQSVGDVFTYNDSVVSATGDGEVRPSGTYLQFTSPVPYSKYVTVYHGFSN